MRKFKVYKFFGRNTVAISSTSRRLHNTIHRYFSGNSWRKKLYRCLLKVSTFLRVSKLISKTTQHPVNINVNKILTDNALIYNHLIINFPSSTERKRVYITALNNDEQPETLIKLAYDVESINSLKAEFEHMREISNKLSSKYINIPEIFQFHYCDSYALLSTQYLNNFKFNEQWENVHKKIIRLLHGLKKDKIHVKNLHWFQVFKKDFPDIYNALLLKRYLNNNDCIEVSNVHGDLHKGNVIYNNELYYLVDWESYSTNGPYLTDYIVNVIQINQKEIFDKPGKTLSKIYSKIKDSSVVSNKDPKTSIIYALIYLSISDRDRKDTLKLLRYITNFDIENWVENIRDNKRQISD